jgi:Tfp pilus assembly protein FimV
VTRTRVRRRRLAATITIAVVGAAWAPAAVGALGARPAPERVARSSYVVREGDTLWSIAERVAPRADPRPVVDALVTVNEVDAGSLVPGQVLVIPLGA